MAYIALQNGPFRKVKAPKRECKTADIAGLSGKERVLMRPIGYYRFLFRKNEIRFSRNKTYIFTILKYKLYTLFLQLCLVREHVLEMLRRLYRIAEQPEHTAART